MHSCLQLRSAAHDPDAGHGAPALRRRRAAQDDARQEAALMPQDRVLAVRPFWETVPQEERVQLLSVSLEELAARAQELMARALKEQGAPSRRPPPGRSARCGVHGRCRDQYRGQGRGAGMPPAELRFCFRRPQGLRSSRAVVCGPLAVCGRTPQGRRVVRSGGGHLGNSSEAHW
jgi:hypothetical protein